MLLILKIGIKIGICPKQFLIFQLKIGTRKVRKREKIKENLGNLYTLFYLFLLYYLLGKNKYIYKRKREKYKITYFLYKRIGI